MIRTVVVLLLPFLFDAVLVSADCVWYGECGGNRNCHYEGPANLLMDAKAVADLLEVCPQFPRFKNGSVLACCDGQQVATLSKQILAMKALVSRCPPCYRSLRTIVCGVSCEPTQASYIAIDKLVPSHIDPERLAVREVTMVISRTYLQSVIDSCKNVQGILGSALSAICFSSNCTPDALIKALTSESLGSPAKFNNIVTDKESIEYNQTKLLLPYQSQTFNCSQSFSNEHETLASCSCADCESACPLYSYNDPKEEKIGSLSVVVFIMLMLTVIAVLMAFGLIVHNVIRILRLQKKLKRDLSAEAFNAQYQSAAHKFGTFLNRVFTCIGFFCAMHKALVIVACLIVCFVLCMGLIFFKGTSDPIALWGVIDGRCIREKEYFDYTFNPFFRTTQVYFRPKNQSKVQVGAKYYGPIYRQEYLLEMLRIQKKIESISAFNDNNETIKLEDICFAPLAPQNKNCTVQSVAQYFENDENKINRTDWFDHLMACINSPYDFDCLSSFESPILPYVVLGDFNGSEYENAGLAILTLLCNNHLSKEKVNIAKKWEYEFLRFIKNFASPNFDIIYSTERSIEDEVGRASKADIATIALSYAIMFVYLSVFLGSFNSWKTIFVNTRLILGLCALFMILISVLSSFGFYSYLGYDTSIIVLQITPFLLLAVGSGDNFIFVNNYMRRFNKKLDMSIEERVAANLGEIGPSLLLSSCAQAIAFGIGGVIPVGAIRTFALYSFLAVLIKFILQVTLFVSIFTIDCKRQQDGRYDCLFCFKQQSTTSKQAKSVSYTLFEKFYCPLLLHPISKHAIVFLFTAWFIACLTMIPKVKIGLDQKITFPKGSYVIDYLDAVETYAAAGAPVYIVVQSGYDYVGNMSQNFMCSTIGCDQDSITNRVIRLASFPNKTYIEYPPSTWIDDYFSWISNDACCMYDVGGGKVCSDGQSNCSSCPTDPATGNLRPLSQDFVKFLIEFLSRNPNAECPKAGKALHGPSVAISQVGGKPPLDKQVTTIGATNFMAYSVVLRNTSEYIAALKFSRQLSNDLSDELIKKGFMRDTRKENGVNPVFVYSVFYPFYEQYISMAETTMLNIVYSIIGVFVVTFFLLGMDFHSSIIVLLTLIMTMIDLFGIMYLSSVDLNAISVVNLVMAVGISVEFYVHIVRDYAMTHTHDTYKRATSVLSNIGSSIFIGITVPEMVSVAMLATAKSDIFQIYFFRMYLTLILMCSAQALIFLPVILTFLGPAAVSSNKGKSDENEDLQNVPSNDRNINSSENNWPKMAYVGNLENIKISRT